MPVKADTVVMLLNLGGPDCEQAIEPFLRNFFSDPDIIGLPFFLRLPLARLIARKRARGEAHESYMALGGKSPLIENTEKQRASLEEALGLPVYTAMRYWHPRADRAATAIAASGAKRVVLLPLYPQYSTATTKSSFKDARRALKIAGVTAGIDEICCWPEDEGFISASADRIREVLPPDPQSFRLLFSAHGLPKRTIARGDPYQKQAEGTAKAIARHLGLSDAQWSICYQSRVGPLAWIGPSIDEELARAARDGIGVVVYPHAFVSEHVETLIELDMMYKKKAQDLGVPFFNRAETVGTHPDFIAGLARLVKSRLDGNPDTKGQKICRNGSTNIICGSARCT